MTDLAQLYALYSDRARSFNQWQRALYLNFIIIYFGANEMILHEAGDVFCILSSQAILTLFRPQKRLTFSPSMFLQLLGFTFPNKAEL